MEIQLYVQPGALIIASGYGKTTYSNFYLKKLFILINKRILKNELIN